MFVAEEEGSMKRACRVILIGMVAMLAQALQAQEGTGQPAATNVPEMKFTMFPGTPTCSQGAVLDGDPGKGPSIIYAKMNAGCVFPWHWHTPAEHVMMVTGAGKMEMKDGKPVTLQPGGFALMPSHHVHQFRCEQACSIYIYSDAAFDMHYVDAQGKELTPADALKAVKEAPAPPATSTK
jgi:quercetin dioxygenase-like cupin family protein